MGYTANFGESGIFQPCLYGASDLASGGATEAWIGKLDVLPPHVTDMAHGYSGF